MKIRKSYSKTAYRISNRNLKLTSVVISCDIDVPAGRNPVKKTMDTYHRVAYWLSPILI
ncbi:hypothetical protein [Patiriisocius hiemis]|uniref:Uncharacterized protein n=1 Tax=Patiriisocius hiemis TaxID=3075604 RepID=A0ABU2YDQ2_9FLAO|nr:hypothetical protein [Constantimarinum sp. W242]MDT0556310.1 hypothetical protein [Constantimarinum sp. W242]